MNVTIRMRGCLVHGVDACFRRQPSCNWFRSSLTHLHSLLPSFLTLSSFVECYFVDVCLFVPGGWVGGGDIRSRPHLYLKKIPLAREMDAACQVVNIVNSSFIFFDPLQGYEFKI